MTKYIITGVDDEFTAKLRADLDAMLNAPPAVSAPAPRAPAARAAGSRPAVKSAPAASCKLPASRDSADSFRGRLRSSLR